VLTEWPRIGLMGLVKAYRLLISPALGSNCRYEPTCSQYALDALKRHGAAAGTYLAVHRIVRCNPWCDGGCDPVPEAPPALFSRLLSPQSQKRRTRHE
jgi:putative membrane protein insertion efficiency factor